MYKVIDLFAGAGGLSLGFIQTGQFEIKVAFEKNPAMQKTYKRNHPKVDLYGDVVAADYKAMQEKYGHIDVVIGGPPCQGFSNANRQKNHAISQNNMLVKQYIRAIQELQPEAFVLENVGMLNSDVHKFYLEKNDVCILKRLKNFPIKKIKLPLLDQKYVFNGVSEIIKDKERIESLLWPEEYYEAMNVIYKTAKNANKFFAAIAKHQKKIQKFSENFTVCYTELAEIFKVAFVAISNCQNQNKEDIPIIMAKIEPAIMIQRMLSKCKEIIDNDIVVDAYKRDNGLYAELRSYAVIDYIKAVLSSSPNDYLIKHEILCAADYGAPQKRMRFVLIGIKKQFANEICFPKKKYLPEKYNTVRDAIEDLQSVPTGKDVKNDNGTSLPELTDRSNLCKLLRDAKVLYNHITTNTRKAAMERFKALKQGQNFHSLDKSLKINTYTDVARTQNTIYLRLNYNKPSGTVVNVRKSMWVHPVLDRAISIREAARLQTFPDSFIFCGTKDQQYQQVGNAVPPIMAKAIAEILAEQLDKCLKRKSV